ncbi:MAG: GNAT family N-acetyltransferase [Chlorobiaceae bacterium]
MDQIRTAILGDELECAALLAILFAQEKEFRADAEAQSRGLAAIIANPELGRVFVYESQGIIRGMVMLLFTVSTWLGKRVAILEDMIIAPEWRKQGIGTALIDHAIDYAQKENFGRITLLTDSDNRSAQRFYMTKGFSKSEMIVFRKLLDPTELTGITEHDKDPWMCRECGWLYNPAEGDQENRIKAATPFRLLPNDWSCPVCFAGKTMFELLP